MQINVDHFEVFMKKVYDAPNLNHTNEFNVVIRDGIEAHQRGVVTTVNKDRAVGEVASSHKKTTVFGERFGAGKLSMSFASTSLLAIFGSTLKTLQIPRNCMLYSDFRGKGERLHLIAPPRGIHHVDELDFVVDVVGINMVTGGMPREESMGATSYGPGSPLLNDNNLLFPSLSDVQRVHEQDENQQQPLLQPPQQQKSVLPLVRDILPLMRDVRVRTLPGCGGARLRQAVFTTPSADTYVVCGTESYCYSLCIENDSKRLYSDALPESSGITALGLKMPPRASQRFLPPPVQCNITGVYASHKAPIQNLAVSKDHNFLLTCGKDGVAAVEDIGTFHCHSLLVHGASVTSGAFSHNNQFIITGCADKMSYVFSGWRLTARPTPLCVFRGHSDPLTCVAAHSSEPMVASGCQGSGVYIWDPSTATANYTVGKDIHRGPITAVSFNYSGTLLLSADPFRVLLTDTSNGATLYGFDHTRIPSFMTHPVPAADVQPIYFTYGLFAPQEYFPNNLVLCTSDGSVSVVEVIEDFEEAKSGLQKVSSKHSFRKGGSLNTNGSQVMRPRPPQDAATGGSSQSRSSNPRRMTRRTVAVKSVVWSTKLRTAICCGRAGAQRHTIFGDLNGNIVILDLVPRFHAPSLGKR